MKAWSLNNAFQTPAWPVEPVAVVKNAVTTAMTVALLVVAHKATAASAVVAASVVAVLAAAAAVTDSKVVQHPVLNNAASSLALNNALSSLVSMSAKTVAVICVSSSALKPVVLKTGVTAASMAHLVKKVAALKVVAQKAVQMADLKVAATAVLKVVSSLAGTPVLPAAALATSLPVVLSQWALAASNPTPPAATAPLSATPAPRS